MESDDPDAAPADLDEVTVGNQSCPVCGAVMVPFELPSGEWVDRCRNCGQTAI